MRINSQRMTHLCASHTVNGDISSEMFSWKYVCIAAVACLSVAGSVNKVGFNRQLHDLCGKPETFKDTDIGEW